MSQQLQSESNFETPLQPGQVMSVQGLTFGLLFPIEAFKGDAPTMQGQEHLAQRAEALGFSSLWFRDVPLRVPSFGDVGQIYDPFVYMAWIAAHTSRISLGTAAIILPLRHPLHVAKMAASIDQLSNGRLLLGVSSGDRPQEFPAFGIDHNSRGAIFREHFEMMHVALREAFPTHRSVTYGALDGQVDLIPKPTGPDLFTPIVGGSQQELDWVAQHADAWLMYPRPAPVQANVVQAWKDAIERTEQPSKPFGQSLYIDLAEDRNEDATAIHLGFRSGARYLTEHLGVLKDIGVNHVIFNLKYGRRPAADVVEELGADVLSALSN